MATDQPQQSPLSTLDDDYIKSEVRRLLKYLKKKEIRKLRKKNEDEFMKAMYSKFAKMSVEMPPLFFHIMGLDNPGDFEMWRLDQMLALRSRQRQGKISKDVADTIVANKYKEDFVNPVVADESGREIERGHRVDNTGLMSQVESQLAEAGLTQPAGEQASRVGTRTGTSSVKIEEADETN